MEAPTLFARLQKRLRTEREEGLRFSLGVKLLLIVATVVCCGLFFPWNSEPSASWYSAADAVVGGRWKGPVVRADYSFVVRKPAEVYAREQQQAVDSILPVFSRQPYRWEELQERIAAVVDSLRQGKAVLPAEIAAMWNGLPEAIRRASVPRVSAALSMLAEELRRWEILNVPKERLPTGQIAVQYTPVVESRLPVEKVLDTAEALSLLRSLVGRRVAPELQAVVLELGLRLVRPTLFYEAELTRLRREAARQSVPRTWGIVHAGEIIVAPGEVVTDTTLAKLRSYAAAQAMYGQERSLLSTLMGTFGQAALICSVLFVYLGFLRPRIFRDNLQLAGLAFGLVAIAALGWASRALSEKLPLEYLVAVPTLSMLVAILLDSRTAFYTTVTAALLVAGVRHGDYAAGLTLMLGGMLAAYTVRDLESRRQLFRSLFFILLGMGSAALVFGLAHEYKLENLLLRMGFVGINAALAPVLTFGMLLLIERLFNVVTDMRLLEYSSLEHPLLQELQHKAPGTYQHTLNVARLAEAAARQIGARTLLVRVGAYFHDIGKVAKPEYFVENQIGLDNKHDRLPPKKSAAIIREHVTEGIELARQYNLPPQIVDFIPQHHGTMLIRAFWQKALEHARARGEPPPAEEDFRYPGPKPQSKEAAILMLADAAEALTHVISPAEPERLAAALDEVIRERILDGQFDECPLTFQELQRVREALLEGMVGIQHRRVSYEAVAASAEHPA